ncbi:MAG: 8-amino-7-oxononanoate synthase [Verrucomicrobiae bacterium]|nr:8-amino-7-oxononanoate synthase [Verrucomicrobiae bacterium]
MDQELWKELEMLRGQHLLRQLRPFESPQGPEIIFKGRPCVNFSSNDYLGLTRHPRIKGAALRALETFGTGTGSARLISGHLPPQQQLDTALAIFKQTEAALVFSSGFAVPLGVIPALVGKGDVVILDKLNHACLIDACRLSGATIRVYPHLDMGKLEEHLKWSNEIPNSKFKIPDAEEMQIPDSKFKIADTEERQIPDSKFKIPDADTEERQIPDSRFQIADTEERQIPDSRFQNVNQGEIENRQSTIEKIPRSRRVLVITETIFSMDGDRAPLAQIVALKEKYGAWLMIDEAHATGVFGKMRAGLADELGLGARVEIQMGTLSKALGSGGGYVAGSRPLIETLVNRARSFIFSTALPPATCEAAREAIELVRSPEGQLLHDQLWLNIHRLSDALLSRGLISQAAQSPIIPIPIGEESKALEVSAKMFDRGFYVPAIRYPTVPKGRARLRVSLTARHTAEQMDKLVHALETVLL